MDKSSSASNNLYSDFPTSIIKIPGSPIKTPEKPTGISIFHGTSTKFFNSILMGGLRPRSETGEDSYSDKDHAYLQSNLRFTYLTQKMQLSHALVVSCRKDITKPAMIIEVDVDQLDFHLLHPDEDYIVYAIRQSELSERTLPDSELQVLAKASVDINQQFWTNSLDWTFRLVAYKGRVPITACKCIKVFPILGLLVDTFASELQPNGSAGMKFRLFNGLDLELQMQAREVILKFIDGHAISDDEGNVLTSYLNLTGKKNHINAENWSEDIDYMKSMGAIIFDPNDTNTTKLQQAMELINF